MEIEFGYVAEWIRIAETDLASAKYLKGMYPIPLEIICYHSQQSAEKYLKGYLIYKGVTEPPKTHDLDDLYEMCKKYDEHFKEIKRACTALSRYGVQPRYPNEMEITEHDMQKALEYACQVQTSAPIIQMICEINEIET